MPGGYGVFLMSLLGEQLWRDDFPEGSSVLFDDLWVRPRGKWLFEVHDAFPETHDPKASQGAVMYGPHVDPKWNQMARFVRRQVLGQGQVDGRKEENDDQPYVLLVDRIKSRRLLDARTGSFEEVGLARVWWRGVDSRTNLSILSSHTSRLTPHATRHRPHNKQVMRVLREEGGLRNVEAIRFEEVPVEEQFHKVMRARILVAVHGAGLTNMLWQPPFDSSVVEVVFSPRKPDYPNMARTIGRGYHYVWAERAEEKYVTPGEKTPNPISYRRVYVDSRKLLAAIKVRGMNE